MPSGIILSSGSVGATQEAIEKVLADNGYEADKPAIEEPTAPVEPKREDFKTDEEFESAQTEFEAAQEDAEEKQRQEEERKRLEALPRKSRTQKAIEKATKKLAEENKKLEERLAALEGKKPTEPKPEELKAPKREDFKTDEEFEEAKFQYRYKLQRQKEQGEESKKAIETHQREMLSNYQAAKDEIKEEYADWNDTLEQFGESPVSASVYVAILSLEEGPRVSYYLAKHPDELEKLNAMFPDQATREVIRLHDRLKTKTPPKGTSEPPKPRPKLPAPVVPVSTSATNSTATSRDAAASRDYRAFKRAQRAGR
jgi:hypothetical protein